MEKIGIICEYNPFHYGHIYHIKKIKELYPDSLIILVMSGHFLQRGEVSIINKWDKTSIVLENNIDLVIELPFVFATQSSDIFAKGAVEILNHLDVDKIIFGSECNDINLLTSLANIQTSNKEYENLVKKYLDSGINYPTAMSKALSHYSKYKIESPNDILGLSYIKEIIKTNSKIKPICIKRTNNYHNLKLKTKITSASSIRNALKNNKNIKKYIPKNEIKYINKIFIDDYFELLKYKIISSDDLGIFQTVDEGIENRIKKYILSSNSLDELINNIKTKRYTYNKLKRMFVHILCDFKKEDALKYKHIEYIRVLGFNNNGKLYLNKIKKSITIPVITNYSKNISNMLEYELKSTIIYSLKYNKKGINIIECEYKNKPIIY